MKKLHKALRELNETVASLGPLVCDKFVSPIGDDGAPGWWYASAELVEERVGAKLSFVGLLLAPPQVRIKDRVVIVTWPIVHIKSGQTMPVEVSLPMGGVAGMSPANEVIALVGQSRRWALLWAAGVQPVQPDSLDGDGSGFQVPTYAEVQASLAAERAPETPTTSFDKLQSSVHEQLDDAGKVVSLVPEESEPIGEWSGDILDDEVVDESSEPPSWDECKALWKIYGRATKSEDKRDIGPWSAGETPIKRKLPGFIVQVIGGSTCPKEPTREQVDRIKAELQRYTDIAKGDSK